MNQWLKFHKEVLREERREAALVTRTQKSARTPADSVSRPDQPALSPARAQSPRR